MEGGYSRFKHRKPSIYLVSASHSQRVWVYALLLLSAYRTWELLGAPPISTRWWRNAKRWSFNTLWRQFRAALWGTSEIQVIWTRTPDNWLKKEALLSALSNSIAASTRI